MSNKNNYKKRNSRLVAFSPCIGKEEIDEIIESIVDPAGLFYRYSLPGSILGRKVL